MLALAVRSARRLDFPGLDPRMTEQGHTESGWIVVLCALRSSSSRGYSWMQFRTVLQQPQQSRYHTGPASFGQSDIGEEGRIPSRTSGLLNVFFHLLQKGRRRRWRTGGGGG